MPDKNCRKTFLSLKKIDLVQLKKCCVFNLSKDLYFISLFISIKLLSKV